VDGVQPGAAPAQVSRRKIPPEDETEPKFVAWDSNVM
jgi:hypothetical protein